MSAGFSKYPQSTLAGRALGNEESELHDAG